MRLRASAWLLALGALVVVDARVARADEPTATELIERGLDLRQAHRDAEALALFETAQRTAPSPRGQAQVALAQQALGRWVLAEKNLRAALAVKSDGWIESKRPILERALAVIATHLGDVEIVGAKGAVFVDGVQIDEPDALTHLRLEVGRRSIEIRAEGLYPFSRVIDVFAGDTVHIEVEQHPLLGPPPAPPRSPSPPSSTEPSPPADPGHTQRTIGWVSVAGAGVFLLAGGGGLLFRSLAASNFNGDTSCTSAPSNKLPAQCSSWLDQGSTGSTLAIVGFVGGGIVGALSIALLATAPSAKPQKTAALQCAPMAGGSFCSVGGTF